MAGLRRTFLFVPGNNPRMIEKSTSLGADMVVLDWEDAVLDKEKEHAREVTLEAFRGRDWGSREVGVRINGLETPYWLDDLKSAGQGSPDFIVIPKVEDAVEIRLLDHLIRFFVGKKNPSMGIPNLVVTIESAKGLLRVQEILAASDLITAVEFGAEDYSLSLGLFSIERSPEATLYARSKVVAVACANSIDPLDQAYLKLNDLEGLRASAAEARRIGFKGKAVIHPSQIELVNEIFNPSSEEINWARKVLDAWKMAEREGRGVVRMDDRMVDIVHVKMAERIIKASESAKAS